MEPINRFIFEIDGKVYSFQDCTWWDESSYNWRSGECVEKQIGVFIPYYQHIRNACKFSKLLIPPKCKTTFIIAGKVINTFSLKSLNFGTTDLGYREPFIKLTLVGAI